MNSQQRKTHTEQLLRSFSELGTRYQLSFSSQLNFPGILVGIDGIRRIMLVVKTGEAIPQWKLVDLVSIRNCTLLRNYEPIPACELRSYSPDRYLQAVHLRILTVNNEEILLPFYVKHLHNLKDLPRIAKTAQDWHHMILKLLPGPVKA
ncbi:MAG: hypothetical protein ACXWV0_01900 [Flavisolibacter sp.]